MANKKYNVENKENSVDDKSYFSNNLHFRKQLGKIKIKFKIYPTQRKIQNKIGKNTNAIRKCKLCSNVLGIIII